MKKPPQMGRQKEVKFVWKFSKPTKDRSRVELELQEAFEYVHELEVNLRKLNALVDDLYFKAQISNSLLVTSKISNDKIESLNRLLEVP